MKQDGKVLLVLLFSEVFLFGCKQEDVVIQGKSAFLYATASDCHWSGVVGPDEHINRAPRGIQATMEVGTRLQTAGEDIGKDTICYSVTYRGIRGFVLGSCGRVDVEGSNCKR
jgi:hypothetical protein